MEMIEVIIKRF